MNLIFKTVLTAALAICSTAELEARKWVFHISDFGVIPTKQAEMQNGGQRDTLMSGRLQKALAEIRQQVKPEDKVVLKFAEGRYDFHATDAAGYELYISNHDQDQPKKVGFYLDGWHNLTIDGGGADFVFHGRMIPFVLKHSTNCTLKNLSVDFENPQIAQVQVVKNSDTEGITFEVAPWVNYRIGQNGRFETFGEGWTLQQGAGIAFERDSRHIVYNTSDLGINTAGVRDLGGRQLLAPNWKDKRLVPGTIVAMRGWGRPCPGIVLANNRNTTLQNVKVHYAEGMGLIAQRCTDITLEKFGVCLRGADDPRYFTTQADATHFSQCNGKITSNGGTYEGMMDDAINIHGVYLRIKERVNDRTLRCSYEHHQAYGFDWGDAGDEVTFVRSATMDDPGHRNVITEIKPADKNVIAGCKEFLITLRDALPAEITADEGYGIENLTWTPEVEFRRNVVRNNRARGALFSSPRRTVCTDNLFDHTSGTAILLCGDCNGWYESGACRDLVIRRNTFINALTNMFQFTNAVISIYPEIPNIDNQKNYFHGGHARSIVIENNYFDTFDAPLLYAKSVDGLIFRKNQVRKNTDYKPFHWNKQAILLEHCTRTEIEEAKPVSAK